VGPSPVSRRRPRVSNGVVTDVATWFEEHEAELFHAADEAGMSPELARVAASLVLAGADDDLVLERLRSYMVVVDDGTDAIAGAPWLLRQVRLLTPVS
jgi:hypothetical protein